MLHNNKDIRAWSLVVKKEENYVTEEGYRYLPCRLTPFLRDYINRAPSNGAFPITT